MDRLAGARMGNGVGARREKGGLSLLSAQRLGLVPYSVDAPPDIVNGIVGLACLSSGFLARFWRGRGADDSSTLAANYFPGCVENGITGLLSG